MPVAVEPRRFGKHKIYHIILQEVRNNVLADAVQIPYVTDKNEHFHLQSTGGESNYLGGRVSHDTAAMA